MSRSKLVTFKFSKFVLVTLTHSNTKELTKEKFLEHREIYVSRDTTLELIYHVKRTSLLSIPLYLFFKTLSF